MTELHARLLALGLTDKQIEGVNAILFEGLNYTIKDARFELDSPAVTVKAVNEGKLVCHHEIHIAGVDPNQIKALTLPTFSYSDASIMEMQVTLLPAAFGREMSDFAKRFAAHKNDNPANCIELQGE